VRNNSVRSRDITDNSLSSRDVHDSALTGSDILDATLNGGDLANGSVEGLDVRGRLGASGEVHNGSLRAENLQAGLLASDVRFDNFAVPAAPGAKAEDVACPAGPARGRRRRLLWQPQRR
jgi:hypothetical protein